MEWEFYLLLAGAGALGQLVRVCYGLKQALDKGKDISFKRLVLSLVSGASSGALIGVWTQDFRSAFFGGIAATDMIEGILKASKGK